MSGFNRRLYQAGGGGGSGTGFAVVDDGVESIVATDTVSITFAETFTDTDKMMVEIEPTAAGVVKAGIALTLLGATITLSAAMTGDVKWRATQTS